MKDEGEVLGALSSPLPCGRSLQDCDWITEIPCTGSHTDRQEQPQDTGSGSEGRAHTGNGRKACVPWQAPEKNVGGGGG